MESITLDVTTDNGSVLSQINANDLLDSESPLANTIM